MNIDRFAQRVALINDSIRLVQAQVTTKVGNHTVVYYGAHEPRGFFNNPEVEIAFDGKPRIALLQGMINIWAFPDRTLMSLEEQKEFDDFINKCTENKFVEASRASELNKQASYDVNVVGGFNVGRDISSISEAKRIAKEKSTSGSLVQVIDLRNSLAIAEYQNGKPLPKYTHF